MDNMFKSDKDYNYKINLEDDRELPQGHPMGFTETDTDVTAIKKMLDAYVDTTSADTIVQFIDRKLDFSVTFLDSMCLILRDKVNIIEKELCESERELDDISHKMTRAYLVGKTFTSHEKVEMFNIQQELFIKRRDLKDTMTAMKVLWENIEKSRNFILGMNRRMYGPKSERFKNDPEYIYISREENAALNGETTAVSIEINDNDEGETT